MSIISIVGDALGKVTGLIDNLHTSGEEKLKAKAELLAVQSGLTNSILEYESKLVNEQGQTVRQEIASSSKLASSWRPIVMLWFAALIGAHWLGFTPENLSPESIEGLLGIVKLGLGGYVIGRSAEKVIPATFAAMKSRENV